MEEFRIFSPATVANVSCGFDAMAFALSELGDEMIFHKNNSGEVSISEIKGAELPLDPKKNAAGVVALSMLKDANAAFGLDMQIVKNYKPGSGLGSSAASSAGAAFAVNHMLGNPYSSLELVKFAMLGEEAACGSQIADNVAAALYGGFALIRSYEPLDIVPIPTPEELCVVIIHPQIEVKTEEARNVLPKTLDLNIAISQWANVGGLISGLHASDYDLISKSLIDYVAEPYRKKFIPEFDGLKKAAMDASALGAGISGSGPSVFALTKSTKNAENVANAMKEFYMKTGVDFKIYVSRIGKKGVRLID